MFHIGLLWPILGLVVFWIFPLPVAAAIYVLILGYSAWRYRSIVRLMHRPVSAGPDALIGREGEIVSLSDKTLQIQVNGEVWSAEPISSLEEGNRVRVTGVHGLTLLVEAVKPGEDPGPMLSRRVREGKSPGANRQHV